MSNAIKGSIVDVEPAGCKSYRALVIGISSGACGDKLIEVVHADCGDIYIVYDYEVSDYLIRDINDLTEG